MLCCDKRQFCSSCCAVAGGNLSLHAVLSLDASPPLYHAVARANAAILVVVCMWFQFFLYSIQSVLFNIMLRHVINLSAS